MISLRGPVQGQPLSFNVIFVLCIWVLVGGLAWADSFDLTDDIGMRHASAGALVDLDDDEVREARRGHAGRLGLCRPHPAPQSPAVSFDAPFNGVCRAFARSSPSAILHLPNLILPRSIRARSVDSIGVSYEEEQQCLNG